MVPIYATNAVSLFFHIYVNRLSGLLFDSLNTQFILIPCANAMRLMPFTISWLFS